MEFTSFDGKKIYVHEWLDVKEPIGIVQIIHGMTEHGARYNRFAQFLNEHGYLVIADDHRGHGLTDPNSLGYCPGNMFEDTIEDEALIMDYFKNKYPNLSYFIFGFSFGSFLTQSFIGKYGHQIDGAIIAGSSYKKDREVYEGAIVSALGDEKKPGEILAKLSFGEYAKKFPDGQWLSTNVENNLSYEDDTLSGFTCSNRFYNDFFNGLKKLYTKEYISSLNKNLPLLIVSGKDDPVGDMGKGVRKLYHFYKVKAGMKNVDLVLFNNSRHEFLNELNDKEEKWNTILNFLEKNTHNK